jgi:cobalt-zinc-cadmium efflux system protein
MWMTGWLWLDPAASILIAGVITVGTWGLLRESIDLAMDAVPASVDPHEVELYLAALPDVASVHDLHIWGMSTTECALTAHLVMRSIPSNDRLMGRICRELHDRFSIEHPTIQFEHGDGESPCAQEPSDVV